MGLVPHRALVGNTAPFVPAFEAIFTHGAWAGKFVAAVAVVSAIGALNGWTAGASVLFSMWVTFASGYSAVYQALVLVLVGVVVYTFLIARRERLGEAPEPADLPAGHRGGD